MCAPVGRLTRNHSSPHFSAPLSPHGPFIHYITPENEIVMATANGSSRHRASSVQNRTNNLQLRAPLKIPIPPSLLKSPHSHLLGPNSPFKRAPTLHPVNDEQEEWLRDMVPLGSEKSCSAATAAATADASRGLVYHPCASTATTGYPRSPAIELLQSPLSHHLAQPQPMTTNPPQQIEISAPLTGDRS
jgi:hypothetical protein